MGKPIAGRDKFPFGSTGIIVAGAKLADGTVKTGLRISKQCSVIRFDLLDPADSSLFSKLLISTTDANGVALDITKTDAELAALLAPGTFFVRAVNASDVQEGLVIRFQLNKVIIADGTAVYDMDYSKGASSKVDVTGVTLSKSTSAILTGSTETLIATVAPSNATVKTLTWSSSAPSIATVNASGLVTGVANGSANITATTVDGAFSTVCSYTVTTAVQSITASPATASIAVGETQQITQTFVPSTASNKNVTYVSSAPGVATVSTSGLVTAVANGTTTITVTTQDGAKTSTSAITVSTPVSGVTLNKTTANSNQDETDQLTATVAPSTASDKTVSWSSSDTSIATVSNSGLVSFVGQGSVVITATTTDGAYSATCTYTVGAPATHVDSVSLPANSTVYVGRTTQLTATVLPSNATNKTVTWASSDTSVATVNASGLVTGVANGNATITATSVDGGKVGSTALTCSTYIATTSITADRTSVTLARGATTTVTITRLPENASSPITSSMASQYNTYLTQSVSGNILTITAKTTAVDIGNAIQVASGSAATGDSKTVSINVTIT